MTDESNPTVPDSDRHDDLRADAEDLIDTEGLWRGRILYTGVEVGLFDVLESDPRPATDLASELGLDADRTYRLLRALAYFDVLDETANRCFSLTPVGALFQADHPQSVQTDLMFNRSPEWVLSMLHLSDVVTDGGPPGFVREFGCGFFEYVTEHPGFADRYNALMESASRNHPDQILDALDGYDFSRLTHVCDVGGGRGHLLCHLLEAIPHLRGTVLDLPTVVSQEEVRWAPKLGVADRCTYLGGDMFTEVPEADAYVLKWILHNWDDEDCQQILSTIYNGAPPDARLFIIESIVPGARSASFTKRLDITMMVQVGGRERTKDEYVSLLEQTGWEFVERRESDDGSLSVLEAVKA